MWIAHKVTTRDGSKRAVAKWNMIGRIQFKCVKNCFMFMKCNDWVYSDWTLLSWYVLKYEMGGLKN